MVIKIVKGNILNEVKGILVHSLSAQGVMGSGLALQIIKKYPQVFDDYMYLIDNIHSSVILGATVNTKITDGLIIVSGIGQFFYGREPGYVYTDYDAIKSIFNNVNILALKINLPVIFPRIGAGLGGGKWDVIETIIEESLDP